MFFRSSLLLLNVTFPGLLSRCNWLVFASVWVPLLDSTTARLSFLLLVGAWATCGFLLSGAVLPVCVLWGHLCSVLQGTPPGAGLLGHRACTCVVFSGHCKLLSKVVEPVRTPEANSAKCSFHRLYFLTYMLSAVYIFATLVGTKCLFPCVYWPCGLHLLWSTCSRLSLIFLLICNSVRDCAHVAFVTSATNIFLQFMAFDGHKSELPLVEQIISPVVLFFLCVDEAFPDCGPEESLLYFT